MSATQTNTRSPNPWPARLTGFAVFSVLVAVAAIGLARQEAKPDTGKVVSSISITSDGIVIEGRVTEDGDTIRIVTAKDAAKGAERAVARAREKMRQLEEMRIREFDSEGHDIVRFGEDIHVRADKRIRGSVVSIGGSVYVEGQVVGDVVSVGGSVTLESGSSVNGDAVAVGGSMKLRSDSSVRGDAVAVGGKLIQDEGAYVAGDTVSMGFLPLPGFLFGGFHSPFAMRAVGISGRVVWVLLTLFLAWASVAIFPDRVRRMVDSAGSSIWLSALVGFAVLIALPLALLLLSVTLIGIPVAVIIALVVFPLASIVAYAVGAGLLGYRFGSRIVSKAPQEISVAQAVVLGVLIVGVVWVIGKLLGIAVFLWPLAAAVGAAAGLAAIFIYLVGLGSLLLTRFGAEPKPVAVPATPTPQGPAPGAPPGMGGPPASGGSPAGGGTAPVAPPAQS